MKIFLLKDVEKVGMAQEMVRVSDGFAKNYLFPRKLALEVTPTNEASFAKQVKVIEKRHEVVESKTSMLAERIKAINLTLRRKMHDDGKLYGSVNPIEIVELMANHGISIAKNQVEIDKSIKEKGTYEVTIKLSSRLRPKIKVSVVPEAA